MRIAEQVTFAGGGLDRAAHLRADSAVLVRMRREAGACILPVWRGKPLIAIQGDTASVALLDDGHPVLAGVGPDPLFIGLADGAPRFAVDVSALQLDIAQDDLAAFRDPSRQPLPGGGEEPAFTELRLVMAGLNRTGAALAATARSLLSWHRSHAFCSACGQPSDLAQAGWQRSCPACGTQHFPRTDPVVIMLVTQGNSVLLGRSPGWPEGMYSLLAGFAEPGETIEDAARREVFEETGITLGRVGYLSSQPWPYPSSLMVGVRAEALGRDITLDENELVDALWLSREEVLDVFAGRHALMKQPRHGAIAHFLLENWLADRLD